MVYSICAVEYTSGVDSTIDRSIHDHETTCLVHTISPDHRSVRVAKEHEDNIDTTTVYRRHDHLHIQYTYTSYLTQPVHPYSRGMRCAPGTHARIPERHIGTPYTSSNNPNHNPSSSGEEIDMDTAVRSPRGGRIPVLCLCMWVPMNARHSN